MENPIHEIIPVVLQLRAANSPDVQKAAAEAYMTPNLFWESTSAKFVKGINESKYLLNSGRWYRVLSPQVEINVQSVVFDSRSGILYLESIQYFKLFFLPIQPAPARLITRLTLQKESGLYYISEQEDFYHPEDFAALLLPPSAPFVRAVLLVGGTICNLMAWSANKFGFWCPIGTGTGIQTPEDDLYDHKDD